MNEQITWHRPADRLPDSDTIVLIRCLDDDDPVWLGYHTGEFWRYVEGFKAAGVAAWAEMPAGPGV